MKNIGPSEIDWKAVGKRLSKYREMLGLDRKEFADYLNISLSKLASYEAGRTRKTLGSILEICQKLELSPGWFLTNKGLPFGSKEACPLDPLKVDKGAGMRRSFLRKEAEEGRMDGPMLEFVLAVDEYKKRNTKKFASISEIYQVLLFLGYRKVAPRSPHLDCIST